MFNCSQRDISSFRKLIAQTVIKEDTHTHRFPMHSKEMKGTKLLHLHPQPHILQPQDSFWMSSMRGVYARSLNKPQNCPSPCFGTGDVTRALAVPLQWLSWVAHLSSHGAAGLFVAFEDVLPWQTCNRAKSYGLCCHLIIYCSVIYQQHFIRLKT